MRIVAFKRKDGPALAVRRGEDLVDLTVAAPKLPRELAALLAAKGLSAAKAAAKSAKAKALLKGKITLLPPVLAEGSPDVRLVGSKAAVLVTADVPLVARVGFDGFALGCQRPAPFGQCVGSLVGAHVFCRRSCYGPAHLS